jgi:hypothetical protein
MVSLLEHSVATHTRDEAVRLLKEGHVIRHKGFLREASVYLDAKGKVMCSLWSSPSKMGTETFVSTFADSADGWIDLGFRYGNAREALQWMKDGGVVRRQDGKRSECDYFFIPNKEPGRIMARARDGHEYYWGPTGAWRKVWADEDAVLLPPTCKKVTYEELKRHLEKGGRFVENSDSRHWWYGRDGKLMYHAPGGEERLSAYGSYGEDIPLFMLNRLILLPPLEEETPKLEPKLEPKDGATFEEAQRWLDIGGRVRRYPGDEICWYYKRNGEILFDSGIEGDPYNGTSHDGTFCDEGVYRSLWTLIPMDEPANKKPREAYGGARKEGKTLAEAEKIVQHLKGGGTVNTPCARIAGGMDYEWVDGRLVCRQSDARPKTKTNDSGYGADIARFAKDCVDHLRYTLVPAPTKKGPTAEDIIKHLKDGGIVQVGNWDYRFRDGQMEHRSRNVVGVFDGVSRGITQFAASDLTLRRAILLPPPPTRVEVVEHLRKGGKVQWRDGKPGAWTAFAGVLLWTPKGLKKALLSRHNCNGHWFADFTDDEISYLELVAMEKPKPQRERFKPSPGGARVTHYSESRRTRMGGYEMKNLQEREDAMLHNPDAGVPIMQRYLRCPYNNNNCLQNGCAHYNPDTQECIHVEAAQAQTKIAELLDQLVDCTTVRGLRPERVLGVITE